ncbi:hypothetical protein GCM10007940_07280 [Portibacter lacus]|uniref:Signal transduction histidine kinase internal region domain-containing protein n=2 Tax=Portibacter lacus TaxID=1099794 RepID=A0AA37SNZ6_9BACT|nr:hypothetical protein GCM10007940_07280 [Portibacter lacus]
MLLINNNVEQLSENFLGQELYVCIGLAFIIQEYSRFSLLIFAKFDKLDALIIRTIFQFLVIIVGSVLIVTFSINLYFSKVLGYTPNLRELLIFNSIFGFITLMYLLLYKGNQLMYTINKHKLEGEKALIKKVRHDFIDYSHKINADLLYDCLETLIVIMKEDPDMAERLTDDFSQLYRYNLLKMDRELVEVNEEIEMVEILIRIYNAMPYRKTEVAYRQDLEGYVPPGSMIFIFEKIIRSTIYALAEPMRINIGFDSGRIVIKYVPVEKLNSRLTTETLNPVVEKYRIYSDQEIHLKETIDEKVISLPKLQLYESSIN